MARVRSLTLRSSSKDSNAGFSRVALWGMTAPLQRRDGPERSDPFHNPEHVWERERWAGAPMQCHDRQQVRGRNGCHPRKGQGVARSQRFMAVRHKLKGIIIEKAGSNTQTLATSTTWPGRRSRSTTYVLQLGFCFRVPVTTPSPPPFGGKTHQSSRSSPKDINGRSPLNRKRDNLHHFNMLGLSYYRPMRTGRYARC